jgi:hypothetical protein
MAQIPDYLKDYKDRGLTDQAKAGTSIQPPHVSILGGRFTLVDSAGAKQMLPGELQCCIFDVSPVTCKRYYPKGWTQGSADPPLCWSSNGVGPSMDAMEPQADTCDACQFNVRGSAESALTGTPIKACRDEKYLCVMPVDKPDMFFRLVLTPGSFKNWDKFRQRFVGHPYSFDVVVTKVSFEPGKSGVLQFDAAAFIPQEIYDATRKALAGNATDDVCGRLDRPVGESRPALPAQAPSFIAPPAQAAPAQAAPQNGPTGSNGDQPRRRRRTREEIDRDNAAQAAAKPSPFSGVTSAVPPNEELQSALDSVFPPK